jgi:hypothetical protein
VAVGRSVGTLIPSGVAHDLISKGPPIGIVIAAFTLRKF